MIVLFNTKVFWPWLSMVESQQGTDFLFSAVGDECLALSFHSWAGFWVVAGWQAFRIRCCGWSTWFMFRLLCLSSPSQMAKISALCTMPYWALTTASLELLTMKFHRNIVRPEFFGENSSNSLYHRNRASAFIFSFNLSILTFRFLLSKINVLMIPCSFLYVDMCKIMKFDTNK